MAFALALRPHRSEMSEARTTPHSAGRHAALPLQAFLGQGVAEARRSQHGTEPGVFSESPEGMDGTCPFHHGKYRETCGKRNMGKYDEIWEIRALNGRFNRKIIEFNAGFMENDGKSSIYFDDLPLTWLFSTMSKYQRCLIRFQCQICCCTGSIHCHSFWWLSRYQIGETSPMNSHYIPNSEW